ncbi:MAG: hypothetical protein E7650_00385 [Ruminococcaceae bacterium]|nr:hypothetical protein [Oscillospiraceae bacterium]
MNGQTPPTHTVTDGSSKKRTLGFGLVCFGLCFFFNPYFAVIDIFPDFIGALLISLALIPFARFSGAMREAQIAFLRFAAIDVVKGLLLIFTFGGSAMGEQEVLILIIAFLGATLGTLFAVLAFQKLFDAMDTLAIRHDCDALYGVHYARRSRTEHMARFAVIFLICKEALLLLPEFAALLNSTYVDSPFVRLYDFIGVMRLLVIIPALIGGIVYLIVLLRYFLYVKRQTDFRRALGARYAAFVASHPGVHVKARVATALALIGAGACFAVDFYIDLQDIFPDVLGGILILAGILLMKLPLKRMLPSLISVGLYTVCAAISTSKTFLFVSAHKGADINRSEEVAREYFAMWLTSFFEFLVFLALLFCLLFLLRALLIKWGYYQPSNADAAFEERHYLRVRNEFDWQFIKCGILGAVSALCSFLYDYFQTWPNKKAFRLMEALWIPDFVLGLVFAVYLGYTLTLIYGKIKERFEFE